MLEARASDAPVAGVYATYDADGAMTFVGYRRDVLAAVRAGRWPGLEDGERARPVSYTHLPLPTKA